MPGTKQRHIRSIICILGFLLCFSLLAPFCGHSEEKERSIKLICRKDDITLQGMSWQLYRIGERTGSGLALTGEFARYPVDINDISEENVAQKAKTLESYAIADAVQSIASGRTDENGELVFGGLGNGLFLAVGKILQVGNTYYVPSSLILETNETDVSFSYNAYPKFFYATLGGSTSSYTVKKVWVGDEEDSIARPANVTVDLFCNGTLKDTVILNESNNWEYSWKDLEEMNEWHVAERDIPADYTVLIDFNRTQYLIKNSFKPAQTTTTTSSTTSAVTTTSTYTSTPPPTSSAVTKTTVTSPQITTSALPPLIQTGQLWWPVLPLGTGGILLLAFGALMKPKKDDE